VKTQHAQTETPTAANHEDQVQPASGPMSEEVATWYVTFTDGQLQMRKRPDGWCLYDPQAETQA
jgi:hypothetical protein